MLDISMVAILIFNFHLIGINEINDQKNQKNQNTTQKPKIKGESVEVKEKQNECKCGEK